MSQRRGHSAFPPPSPPREPTESISHVADRWDAHGHPLEVAGGSGAAADLPEDGPDTPSTRIETPSAKRMTPPPAASDPSAPFQIPDDRPKANPVVTPARARPAKTAEKPELRVGAVLGSYKLTELIGKGGMGFVYRAEHVRLGRAVALKLLRADYAQRKDAVSRFFNEARTVNRVRNRYIVDITDFVELPDGTTFIIMELLSGESLGKWSRRGFQMSKALELFMQICEGLAAAHSVGIVHRDLKPDNVFIVTDEKQQEQVKLLDFGVAKLVHVEDEEIGHITQAGSVVGTPAYMSPEQAGGLPIDERSDIYSLGAIMYEVFCGQPMFRGKSFGEYVRKHLSETPPRPRQTGGGSGISETLESIILRCIERNPSSRYQNATELRADLQSYADGGPPRASMLGTIPVNLKETLSKHSSHDISPSQVVSIASIASDTRSSPQLSPPRPPTQPPVGIERLRGQTPEPLPMMRPATPEPTSPDTLAVSSGTFSLPAPTSTLPPVLAPSPPRRRIAPIVISLGLAAGIGAGVAILSASRSPEAAPGPRVEPLPSTAPSVQTPATPMVEARIESTPPADVMAKGGATALCTTPCTITIDPLDGGPREQRIFVVRRADYLDQEVTVDLRRARHALSVTLAPVRPVLPVQPAVQPEDAPRPATAPKLSRVKDEGDRPPPGDPPVEPIAPPPPRDPPRDPPREERTPSLEKAKPPADKQPPPVKKVEPIDTMNPFGK